MGESNEGHEPEASRVPYSEDDVVRVAAQLDSVAEERSRYRRFTAARDAFLSEVDGHDAVEGSTDPQDDDPESEPAPAVGPAGNWQADLDTDEIDDEYEFDDEDDRLASKLPTLEAAAWAAMRYHVDITVHGGKERARLEPNFRGPDHSEPPDTRKVSAEIQGAWTDLAVAVTRPAAKATLSHLAFRLVDRELGRMRKPRSTRTWKCRAGRGVLRTRWMRHEPLSVCREQLGTTSESRPASTRWKRPQLSRFVGRLNLSERRAQRSEHSSERKHRERAL